MIKSAPIDDPSRGDTVSPLFRLPTDVWILIFSCLSSRDYAALSSSNKRILMLVDQIAWKDSLQRRRSLLLVDRTPNLFSLYCTSRHPQSSASRSQWWYASRYLALLARCWRDVVLDASSSNIPGPKGMASANDQRHRQQSQIRRRLENGFATPAIVLGCQWLVVAVRSELYLLPASGTAPSERSSRKGKGHAPALDVSSGYRLQDAHKISLDSQNAASNAGVQSNPWQDVTSIERLNRAADRLLVGYADGNVHVLRIRQRESEDSPRLVAQVEYRYCCAPKQQVVDVAVEPMAMQGLDKTSPSHASMDNLVAFLTKRGRLALHLLDAARPANQRTVNGSSKCQAAPSQVTSLWQLQDDGDIERIAAEQEQDNDSGSGTNTPRRYRSVAFNNAPLTGEANGGSMRAWSVQIGSSRQPRNHTKCHTRWVAVGVTAQHAVYLYPVQITPTEIGLNTEPWYVASTGHRTSVYAMATAPPASPIPSFLLFVGFYDGAIRVYDTRQMDSEEGATENTQNHGEVRQDNQTESRGSLNSNGVTMEALREAMEGLHVASDPPENGARSRRLRRKQSRELNPIAIFRSDYDTEAVFSLAFGGPSGTHLIVGGSRHSKVSIFDVSMLSHYDVPLLSAGPPCQNNTDWTAFAIPASNSPQYGIVADADRIFGVTDKCLWWFDFGSPIAKQDEGRNAEEDQRNQDGKGIGYFRHHNMLLSHSTSRLV